MKDSIKETFIAECPLTIHWDGKFLQHSTSENHQERDLKVERISIHVSGNNQKKI